MGRGALQTVRDPLPVRAHQDAPYPAVRLTRLGELADPAGSARAEVDGHPLVFNVRVAHSVTGERFLRLVVDYGEDNGAARWSLDDLVGRERCGEPGCDPCPHAAIAAALMAHDAGSSQPLKHVERRHPGVYVEQVYRDGEIEPWGEVTSMSYPADRVHVSESLFGYETQATVSRDAAGAWRCSACAPEAETCARCLHTAIAERHAGDGDVLDGFIALAEDPQPERLRVHGRRYVTLEHPLEGLFYVTLEGPGDGIHGAGTWSLACRLSDRLHEPVFRIAFAANAAGGLGECLECSSLRCRHSMLAGLLYAAANADLQIGQRARFTPEAEGLVQELLGGKTPSSSS